MAISLPARARCRFKASRRAAVAVLFATAVIPLIATVGLAVDYVMWNQINSSLKVAADTAALNAARIAGNAEVAGESQTQSLSEGTLAGQRWFNAVASFQNATVTPTVSVTGTTTITATVTYSGTDPSLFGRILYKLASYPISGQSVATVTVAPFLDVEVLMDDSSSMQQGASATDIENMDYWSACSGIIAWGNTSNDTANPLDTTNGQNGTQLASQTTYTYHPLYTLGSYNQNYSGAVPYPIPINAPNAGTGPDSGYGITSFPTFQSATSNGGPICKGFTFSQSQASPNTPIRAGEPCAFACHTDTSGAPAGTGADLYGLARQTIGTQHPVQLRFDIVKLATNDILQAMKSDDLAINNLSVGIFTFNDALQEIYPVPASTCPHGAPVGEACDNWATAIADVGLPPTTKGGADTGIQAEILVGNNAHSDTDFVSIMTDLQQNYLKTNSGDGTTAANARKVLFLITDGIDEKPSVGNHSAFDYTQCTTFKNMGYTIYVAYTPYTPYPDKWYESQVQSINEGTGAGTIAYNLQQCATDPTNGFIVASDQTTLNNALNTFLKSALNAPARFTN